MVANDGAATRERETWITVLLKLISKEILQFNKGINVASLITNILCPFQFS